MTERTFSMSAGLEASTVTPGMTAPDVSRTTPAMFPGSAWAHAVAGSSTHPTSRSHADLTIVPPFQPCTRSERHDAEGAIRHSSHVLVKRNLTGGSTLTDCGSDRVGGILRRLFSNKPPCMEVRVVRRLLLIAVLLMLPVSSFAQDATLSGTVRDSSGGVL